MHNSVALSTVVMLCHNHHYHFQNLFIIPNRHCIPIKPQLPISATQPLVVSTLFSVSMILPIIDTLYKWNHTILSFFVWLLSLSKMFLRFVHIVAHITISFVFKDEYYSILFICHILFTLLFLMFPPFVVLS